MTPESDKLWAESNRLWAESDKLRAESDKLWAESDKLLVGGPMDRLAPRRRSKVAKREF